MPRPRSTVPKKPARIGPPRNTVLAIIKRYLKEDAKPVWSREMMVWKQLWPLYPSLHFWTHHELSFGNNSLNSMAYFLSEDGAEALKTDWLLFHYVPPEWVPIAKEPEKGLDTGNPNDDDTARYTLTPVLPPTPSRPATLADYFKSSNHHHV